jgi:hypothetical protein
MQSLHYARVVRKKIVDLTATLSIEQLNVIPEGYNNNIAWHLGHLVVSTQLLCYVRTGVQAEGLIKYADKYRNGSKPDLFIEQGEIDELTSLLLSTIDNIEADFQKGIFNIIESYSTHTFGLTLQDIEDVWECCALHDTLHWGNMISMKKVIAH